MDLWALVRVRARFLGMPDARYRIGILRATHDHPCYTLQPASFTLPPLRNASGCSLPHAGEPLFPQTQSSDPSKQDEQAKMDLETYLAAFDWIKDNIVLIRHEVMEDDFTGGAGGGGGEGLVTLGGGAGGGTAGSSHYEPCTIDWILKTATLAVRE